ncbi:hypothetical protein Ais01nite_39640 [Asanoa ishikariensis]|nr:hypothetical protein Ais01nite_39640 [Asanoa ishikariensis]
MEPPWWHLLARAGRRATGRVTQCNVGKGKSTDSLSQTGGSRRGHDAGRQVLRIKLFVCCGTATQCKVHEWAGANYASGPGAKRPVPKTDMSDMERGSRRASDYPL